MEIFMSKDVSDNVKVNEKVSARARALKFIKEIEIGLHTTTQSLPDLISILFDWGQEQYIQRVVDDEEVFFKLFKASESVFTLTIKDGEDLRWLLRSIFFSLSRTMDIKEDSFTGGLKFLLNNQIGEQKLLLPGEKKNNFSLNVNYMKYHIWKGIEIEEENAVFDLMRFIAIIIPNDSTPFGYSKLSVDIVGDGIIEPLDVTLNIGEINDDVTLEMLSKSLTTIIKLVKSGYDLIRDVEGDIGWVEIMGKFYEKCNDPVFLTKKIGIKVASIYQLHKEKINQK